MKNKQTKFWQEKNGDIQIAHGDLIITFSNKNLTKNLRFPLSGDYTRLMDLDEKYAICVEVENSELRGYIINEKQ